VFAKWVAARYFYTLLTPPEVTMHGIQGTDSTKYGYFEIAHQIVPLEILSFVLKFLNGIGDLRSTLGVNRLWNRVTILSQKQLYLQIQEFSEDKSQVVQIENLSDITNENKLFCVADLMQIKFLINTLKKHILNELKNKKDKEFKLLECSYDKITELSFFNKELLFKVFKLSLMKVVKNQFHVTHNTTSGVIVILRLGTLCNCENTLDFLESTIQIQISEQINIFDLARVYKLLDETDPGFFDALTQIFTLVDHGKMAMSIELVKANAIQHNSFKILCPIIAGILVHTDGVDKAAEFINSLLEGHAPKIEIYLQTARLICILEKLRDQAIQLVENIPSKSDQLKIFNKLLSEGVFDKDEVHRSRMGAIVEKLERGLLDERRMERHEKILNQTPKEEWEESTTFCTLF
jgi:hypothetical protein